MKSLLTALVRIAAALERLGEGGGPRRLWSNDDVAAIFARDGGKDWWMHHKKTLMETHFFPAPVAGTTDRWDPKAIAAWQDNQLGTPATLAQDVTGEAGADQRLAGRAAAIVARAVRETTGKTGLRVVTPNPNGKPAH